MDITTTTKGKPLLRFEGHEYLLDRTNKDGSQYWRCILHRKLKCHTTITTHNDTVKRFPSPLHCHETDLVRSMAKDLQKNMKASVRTQPGVSTRQIVARALSDTPDEVLAVLPKKKSLMVAIQAERRKIDGAPPNPRDTNFDIPAQYQELVLFDSGRDDPNRIIILGNQDLVQKLDQASEYFVDGTFDVCPEMYCQLYSFHCKIGSNYPPCLYALLPNKEEITYDRLLDAVINRVMTNPNPTRILVDFEQAALNSFRRHFPNAEISGCYFHLTQCIVRKVGSLGLKRRFDSDMDFKLKIKSLAALSFVPENEVQNVFDALTLAWPEDDASFELLGYFSNNWVVGVGNRPPKFPLNLWNHHATAAVGGPRTTNCCEGWHNSLNSHFLSKHPSIWKLFDGLKEDINLNRLILTHAETGVEEARARKYQILQQRVRDTVNGYAQEQDKLRYLKRLAALQ